MAVPYLITNRDRLAALRGWRGIATLFIIIYHFHVFFSEKPLAEYGFLGIDFLFLMAGFMLSRRYEAAIALGKVSFKQFLIRRFTRLYPIYILSIALFYWVSASYIVPNMGAQSAINMGTGPQATWNFLLQLTMLGNIGGMGAPWNGPAWFTSVVWLLNLLFFPLAWKMLRIPTYVWGTFIILNIIYLLEISTHSLNLSLATTPFYNPTIARGIINFSIGALLFRFHQSLRPLPHALLHIFDLLVVAIMVVFALYYGSAFIIGMDYLFVLLLFPLLVIISLYRQSFIARIASFPLFTFLGRISYSLFLLHMPVAYAYQYSSAIHALNLPAPQFGLTYLALLVALSTLCYLLIELPCRLYGRKLAARW